MVIYPIESMMQRKKSLENRALVHTLLKRREPNQTSYPIITAWYMDEARRYKVLVTELAQGTKSEAMVNGIDNTQRLHSRNLQRNAC